MKGVVVQIGEPKSIVLYNNGKIGAIPTPADCHVGMVVTVQYNNKLKIILFTLAAVFLVSAGIFIGAHVTGGKVNTPLSIALSPPQGTYPGQSSGNQIQKVTVAQAKNLRDDTLVALTGNIVKSLGDEKYTFRDATGDITVEIDRKIWRSLSVEISDTVEISGEIDMERGQVIIDIRDIRKK